MKVSLFKIAVLYFLVWLVINEQDKKTFYKELMEVIKDKE